MSVVYSLVRPKIVSGDVFAWRATGFISKFIRKFTGDSYSHVGIAWVVGKRVFVLEAWKGGIRIHPLSNRLPVYRIPCGHLYFNDAIEELMLSQVNDNDDYSYMDCVKAGLGLEIVYDYKNWQCAMFVNEMLRRGGIELDKQKATPGEVIENILAKTNAPIYLVEE